MDKKKNKPVEYVSAAWISQQLGIHASSIDKAWRDGSLPVHLYVLGGRGQGRPIFTKSAAKAWHKEKVR